MKRMALKEITNWLDLMGRVDDHDGTRFTVADPAGDGLVMMTRGELTDLWQKGAKKNVKWAGTIWVRRREPVITTRTAGTLH